MLQAEQERMGLMRPFMTRYVEWAVGILHGDFGESFKDDMPVGPKLLAGLKNTTILASASLFLALLVSIPLGIIAAVRRNSIIDHIVRLLSQAGILLCDEITSALDVTTQAQVIRLINQIREKEGVSIMFVSHDLALISQISDRIIVMKDGVIVESGETASVIHSPREEYTKTLLGSVMAV